MSTLAEMKNNIADDVARSDLTDVIARSISQAIKYYQSTRFFFNESREIEFDTVANQEFYDKYDHAYLETIMKFDYVKLLISNTVYDMVRVDPEEHEHNLNQIIGQPWSYSYYGQTMRIYPVPNAIWTVRVAGHFQAPEPNSDTEKNNKWMTEGNLLIEARAKLNLARKVNAAGLLPTFDDKAILIYKDEEQEAFNELKARTNMMTARNSIKPYDYDVRWGWGRS